MAAPRGAWGQFLQLAGTTRAQRWAPGTGTARTETGVCPCAASSRTPARRAPAPAPGTGTGFPKACAENAPGTGVPLAART